ncbi:MAG: DNA polymerase IV [Eubacteriales bacterium]|nr:DNA polymerase IV [Eubacteriales bacterium]
MERVILHSDMNCFYASVEMLHRPELRDKPMAVGGDPEARHGIVLTANYIAKRRGVKTGMALWQARQVCPEIVFVPPRMDLYLRFSRLAQEIYSEYTDMREPFGIDESWLDVTASTSIKGDGKAIAKEISNRVKFELGLTVSIGVSWNKIFAKFGSDYKKPDAITVINRDNYKDIVWKQPVKELLYVGRATNRKLQNYGIQTVGDLAEFNPDYLKPSLGKMAYVLAAFARGEDRTPVSDEGYCAPIKSIGNSTTTYRDLISNDDVKIIVFLLAESVSARMRENHFKCNVVEISVRDKDLLSFTRQKKIMSPTDTTEDLVNIAMELFLQNYKWNKPIRSIGVRACNLVDASMPTQLNLFVDEKRKEQEHQIDITLDEIRRRFGFHSIKRGLMLNDTKLSGMNAKDDHIVHPHSYFESGNRSGAKAEGGVKNEAQG